MNTDKILELLFYTLPGLITGGVAYYFFKTFTDNEANRRRFIISRANRKDALPLRLQAYERMTLFLERISLGKLLVRISPISTERTDYANYLIAHIEQEFEHNLTQQIYISDECWNVILAAKNTTIQIIRKASISMEVSDADKMRELIMANLMENQSPSSTALSYIKNEVAELW